MCCCEKPTINGQPGYRWSGGDSPSMVYPVNPPEIAENETLLHDEPGRCGGIDSHSYHYRVVWHHGSVFLLVRHGAGSERIRLSLYKQQPEALAKLDSDGRYWILNAIWHAHNDARRSGTDAEARRWTKAAAEGRIKTRKQRGEATVKVWIEE